MADANNIKDFMMRKLGPLPVWAWTLIAVAIFWFFKSGKAGNIPVIGGFLGGGSSSSSSAPNQQTDPAGNVGSIDPSTGYVYGTPEDQAALNANNTGTSGTDTTGTQSGSTQGSAYPDNASWGRAAVNYLAGIGIDPTSANEAVQQYLSSQSLTSAQQGDVNLAIQALGAPPSLPGPTGTPSNPITNPVTGQTGTGNTSQTYATNPPTGFTVSAKGPTTISVKWNASSNATQYNLAWGTNTEATVGGGTATVGPSVTSYQISNLKQGTLYYIKVQAIPAKPGTGTGTTSATTTKSGSSTNSTPTGSNYTTVTVAKWTASNTPWNSTLSGIAAHYGTTVTVLQQLNGISNPNNIAAGSKIKVPVS